MICVYKTQVRAVASVSVQLIKIKLSSFSNRDALAAISTFSISNKFIDLIIKNEAIYQLIDIMHQIMIILIT